MLKKSLFLALALLLLPVSMAVSTGSANATTAIETEATLKARLLTPIELKAALEANGVTKAFPRTVDVPDINFPELVTSGRVWEANDGSVLYTSLLSYIDGRSIPASRRTEVLSGALAKDVVTGYFTANEYLGELEVISENDIAHGFLATLDGKEYEVAIISFIRGNIFGIVMYAATGSNEGDEVLSAFGGQTAKLP